VSSKDLKTKSEPQAPVAIFAFSGWNDAGDAGTTALGYIQKASNSSVFSKIDSQGYFDFTVTRPEVSYQPDGSRLISWPDFEFQQGFCGFSQELITGFGAEPHFRWNEYCDRFVNLLKELGVQRVALLGAFLADVLYSLPVQITGFATDPKVVFDLDLKTSNYEGPTGIVGVLSTRLQDEGFDVASMWAGLPHYVNASPNPRGALALVQKVTNFLDLKVDELPLSKAAADYEERISALVASDPNLAEYVKELKRREFAQ